MVGRRPHGPDQVPVGWLVLLRRLRSLAALWGQVLTIGGKLRRDYPYHPACRPEARREVQRRLDRLRWERGSGEWREAVLERGHEYEAERQVEPLGKATARGRRWTAEEDALLIGSDAPAYTLVEELGGTLYAVRTRYQKLKGKESRGRP